MNRRMNRDRLRMLAYFGLLGVVGLTVYWVATTLFVIAWGAHT